MMGRKSNKLLSPLHFPNEKILLPSDWNSSRKDAQTTPPTSTPRTNHKARSCFRNVPTATYLAGG